MKTDFLKLTIRYPQALDEEINSIVIAGDVLGTEVIDTRTLDDYEAERPDWELAIREELEEELRGASQDHLAQGKTVQNIFFEHTTSGELAMNAMERQFYEQFGGQVEVLEEGIIRNENWDLEWKKHFEPVSIGKRVLILPAWYDEPVETDRRIIRIEPGMAFGTGTHETTALCLEELECMEISGKRTLDVGCGSGILSIFMQAEGAGESVAVDIDDQALRSAANNIALNASAVQVFHSDLLAAVEGSYDIICANLLADIVIRMLDEVSDYLNPGGRLVLSGILIERSEDVSAKLASVGLKVVRTRILGDWIMLAAMREEEA